MLNITSFEACNKEAIRLGDNIREGNETITTSMPSIVGSKCEDSGREGRNLTCGFLTYTMGEYTQRWRLKIVFLFLGVKAKKNSSTMK